MTLDEANNICNKLTEINIAIWNATSKMNKQYLKTQFRFESAKLREAGFCLKRWKQDGKPMFAPKLDRHKNDVMIATNKPDDMDVKRDCTTRCISFCTGVDYNTIYNEQRYNAAIAKSSYLTWRHDAIWEKSLLSRGFTKLILDRRHVSRGTMLRLMSTLPVDDGVVATVSSGHIAAIDVKKRKILDTWNSSGGRVYKMYVPNTQRDVYYNWLKDNGCCL